jgi:regulator of protease activity HflC (stomatin/prohibitin superfamily)
MESNKNVLELLDVLYAMVTDAWSVPLGNDKCIIEREKAVALISDIKANLPSSVAEAQRLVNARDEFIGNAKREAEALRKNAEEQAKAMVEEQEIVRVARAQSAEMLSAAEAKSNELRRVASQYVDDIIRQTVENLNGALTTVKSVQTSLRSVNPQPKAQLELEEEPNPLPVTSNIIIEQRPAD